MGIKRHMGLTLVLTGLLHQVVGLIIYMDHLQPLVTEGVWNTVQEGQWERNASFWFIMFGFMLMYLGYTAHWLMKRKGIEPPTSFGWMLLILCVLGAVIMPQSGFWLGIPQAWLLIRKR